MVVPDWQEGFLFIPRICFYVTNYFQEALGAENKHLAPELGMKVMLSATFPSYLCEQMALLGTQDKPSRPPSALARMSPWRDHSVLRGPVAPKFTDSIGQTLLSTHAQYMSLTDE